jgi:RimJ/RimL family protein N-acetyltransferase
VRRGGRQRPAAIAFQLKLASQVDLGYHQGGLASYVQVARTQMIETARLILRPWRESDLPLFAEQNADPIVMQFLSGVLTRAESDAYVARAEKHLAETGFCKWAVEAPGVAPFIGAVGLTRVKFEASFTPAVEVAWRLHRRYWGYGYATEAAQAAIEDGFARVGLKEIVALTALGNKASIRVMERLGMKRTMEFDHPGISMVSPLRRHVLYRSMRADVG